MRIWDIFLAPDVMYYSAAALCMKVSRVRQNIRIHTDSYMQQFILSHRSSHSHSDEWNRSCTNSICLIFVCVAFVIRMTHKWSLSFRDDWGMTDWLGNPLSAFCCSTQPSVLRPGSSLFHRSLILTIDSPAGSLPSHHTFSWNTCTTPNVSQIYLP